MGMAHRAPHHEVMLRSLNATNPSPTATPCRKCGAHLSVVSIARDSGYYRLTACSPCDERSWTRDGEPVNSDQAIASLSKT